VKRKLFLLILGFLSLKLSTKTFPIFEEFRIEIILNSLVFSPFNWLGSIFLFILGFLAISRVIKVSIEGIMIKASLTKEWKWFLGLLIVFTSLAFESFWAALLALGTSLFYGIMDADIHNKSRYYDS